MPFKKTIFLLYTVCMLLTSLIPMENVKGSPPPWARIDPTLQNLIHVPMFMVFIYLCSQALEEFSMGKAKRVGIVLSSAVLLGIFMEGIQIVIPGRYPSVGDIMLNFIGAVSGVLLLLKVVKNNEKNRGTAD